MSPQSQRTAAQKRQMRLVQHAKLEEQLTEHGYDFCRGCLTNQPPLEWSHIIGQGERPDLRADPDNNVRMCRTCHILAEAGRYDELLNGEAHIAYIELYEPGKLYRKPQRDAA